MRKEELVLLCCMCLELETENGRREELFVKVFIGLV